MGLVSVTVCVIGARLLHSFEYAALGFIASMGFMILTELARIRDVLGKPEK
jgi:hypothetical protein